MGPDLTLLGAQHDGKTLGLALLKEQGKTQAIALRKVADVQPGLTHDLFGRNGRLLREWERGEPYWVEMETDDHTAGSWEIGLKEVGKSSWVWHPMKVESVAAHEALPREPSFLKGPTSPELLAHHARLLDLHRQRQEAGDWAIVDPVLTKDLMEAAGQLSGHDRYLALVWALQSDRRKSPLLYRDILKARTSLGTQHYWTTERELLKTMYQSREARWAVVLRAWLERQGLGLRARWVAGRFGLSPSRVSWGSAFLDADFESGSWGGWEVEGDAFGSRPQGSGLDWASRNPGRQGHFVASSYALAKDQATGELRSPFFALSGETVGILVAGGDDADLAVELVVGDKVIASAKGQKSPSFRRVWWDVRLWEGQIARVRVRDGSATAWGWLAIDDVIVTRETGPHVFGEDVP